MLRASGIQKSYGPLKVLKSIDLHVGKGEIVAIVGASGAGKSTLLHILGTLDNPDAGKVFIHDKDVFAQTSRNLAAFRNQSIGFVFQFHNLLPLLTDRSCLEIVVDTFPGMDSKKLGLCLFQCRLHGLDLLQDVNAIPILIQHAAESSHLALDTAQPPCDCVAGLFAIGHSCSCS